MQGRGEEQRGQGGREVGREGRTEGRKEGRKSNGQFIGNPSLPSAVAGGMARLTEVAAFFATVEEHLRLSSGVRQVIYIYIYIFNIHDIYTYIYIYT